MGIHVVSYSHGSIHSAWRQKEQKSTSLSAHNSNSSIDGVAGYAECDHCAELLLNPSPITVFITDLYSTSFAGSIEVYHT